MQGLQDNILEKSVREITPLDEDALAHVVHVAQLVLAEPYQHSLNQLKLCLDIAQLLAQC